MQKTASGFLLLFIRYKADIVLKILHTNTVALIAKFLSVTKNKTVDATV